jgi:signal transduction histidine kinase
MRIEGQLAVLDVEDTGCGMDEAFIREQLFKPFKTTKGDAGMGIGAFETREYIRSLGGDVEVSSRPGQGTLFRLRLPFSASPVRDVNFGTGSAS